MTREELLPFLRHIVRLDCQGVGKQPDLLSQTSEFGVITHLGLGAGLMAQIVCDDKVEGGMNPFLYEQVRRVVDYGPWTPWKED